MKLWRLFAVAGTHDRTAIYDHVSRSGKYYVKSVSTYSGDVIIRYPSEHYYERYLCGKNKGKQAKEWSRR